MKVTFQPKLTNSGLLLNVRVISNGASEAAESRNGFPVSLPTGVGKLPAFIFEFQISASVLSLQFGGGVVGVPTLRASKLS